MRTSASPGHARTGLRLVAASAVFLAVMWAVVLERIDFERHEAERDAVNTNANLATAFAEHSVRTLKSVEQVLRHLGDEYLHGGGRLELRRVQGLSLADASIYRHLEILDPRGESRLAGTGVNGADRLFFAHHRDHGSADLLIGTPTVGRVTGALTIHVTRRISQPDGTFAGVAMASISPEYFSTFYQHVDAGTRGNVQLVGLDGIVRARYAHGQSSFGDDVRSSALFSQLQRAPVGNFVGASSLDGSPTFVSYRALSEYPLVVAVGRPVEAALADFHTRRQTYLMGAWLTTALLVACTAMLIVVLRRHEIANALAMLSARRHLEAQAKLEQHTHYDPLTALPNRVLFLDRLAQAIAQAPRRERSVAVLLFDLDHFKTVNDTLGHALGDELLREAARRLHDCVRVGDTVARVGSDEFGVILCDLAQPRDAGLVAQKIIAAMAVPHVLHGQEVFVTCSIGIATSPEDGSDPDSLLRNADAAMLQAKEAGRDNCRFYTAAMNERAMEQLRLESDLRHALERDQFELHYQAKASLDDGAVTGFEALVRWRRPGSDLVAPSQFVPALEDSGLIVPVGDWIIGAACRQLAAWREMGLQPLPVAVNLSAKQFVGHDIVATIERALAETRVDASLLEVEITESVAMQNPTQVAAILRQLRDRGIRVSIDDFGTGYSSLGYLKSFPIDALKIDRSFVTGLPLDGDDASIALAVIAMAHSLGLEIIAEGVETDEQRAFLKRHRCDQIQGHLLSPAVPPAECVAMLAAAPAREEGVGTETGSFARRPGFGPVESD